MAGNLLSHRIQTLMLNKDASFPSQAQDAKDMIKEHQRAQRCRLVSTGRSSLDAVRDYLLSDRDDDGQARGE